MTSCRTSSSRRAARRPAPRGTGGIQASSLLLGWGRSVEPPPRDSALRGTRSSSGDDTGGGAIRPFRRGASGVRRTPTPRGASPGALAREVGEAALLLVRLQDHRQAALP